MKSWFCGTPHSERRVRAHPTIFFVGMREASDVARAPSTGSSLSTTGLCLRLRDAVDGLWVSGDVTNGPNRLLLNPDPPGYGCRVWNVTPKTVCLALGRACAPPGA